MTEYPIGSKVVKSLKYRDMLNEIMLSTAPDDTRKTWLVCFLRDQCGWEESSIELLICEKANWTNNKISGTHRPDPKETNRQVQRIFDNCHKYQSSKSQRIQMERYTEDTQRGKKNFNGEVETVTFGDDTTNKKNLSPLGYRVSNGYGGLEQELHKQMPTQNEPPQTIRTVANIHNGSKFYRIVEKEGQYGSFYSLESGWINDAEYEGKQIRVSGRPEKFFTLPNDTDTLKKIVDGIQQLIPEEPAKKKK